MARTGVCREFECQIKREQQRREYDHLGLALRSTCGSRNESRTLDRHAGSLYGRFNTPHNNIGGSVRKLKTVFFLCAFCAAGPLGSRAQTFTTLLNFDNTNGAYPVAGLAQGLDGNFYGTTNMGGTYDAGTVYKVTPGGTLTTLFNFCDLTGCVHGYYPVAGLVQATDGNFYGTTYYGGTYDVGTVFQITPAGTLNTLFDFCNAAGCVHGYYPGGPIQGADGNLYGINGEGGPNGGGTVFRSPQEEP
jgi:uncharacterized repeat protein (TIGR03803 family)